MHEELLASDVSKELCSDSVKLLELLKILIGKLQSNPQQISVDLLNEVQEMSFALGGNICMNSHIFEDV